MRNVNSIAGLNERQFASCRSRSRASPARPPSRRRSSRRASTSSSVVGVQGRRVGQHPARRRDRRQRRPDRHCDAVTALAGVLNAYHLPASEAAKRLRRPVPDGQPGRHHLRGARADDRHGPAVRAGLHIPLKDVGAAISTLTKEGIPAANATTYLKNAMVAFLKPSKDMKAAIKETGAASGEQLIKQKGFQGALEAVAKATDGTKAGLQKLFPDIRASAAAFALTGDNAKSAESDVKAFGDTAGASQKVFAEQSKRRVVSAAPDEGGHRAGRDHDRDPLPADPAKGAQQLAAFLQHADSPGPWTASPRASSTAARKPCRSSATSRTSPVPRRSVAGRRSGAGSRQRVAPRSDRCRVRRVQGRPGRSEPASKPSPARSWPRTPRRLART
jgi:hypothetical protein